MAQTIAPALTPERIRELRIEKSTLRARDFADAVGIAEGQLLAAMVGHGATRIHARLEGLMPLVCELGEVMALTRNASCVHERVGTYGNYHAGEHAQWIGADEIDLRMFPPHWVHGFVLEEVLKDGQTRRSIQIFDAAGDAVHKIYLREASDMAAWDRLVAALRHEDQGDAMTVTPRAPVEPARIAPDRADDLRAQWGAMTDTHQFTRLVHRLKMNRLGAYRLAGEPYARPAPTDAVTRLLHAASDQAIPIMVFVGNMGMIQIHSGPVERIVAMGPWINVLDARFDMHLRTDHVAEVWVVNKPTQRGDAVSVEAFDKDGALIAQFFGSRKHGELVAWNALAESLVAPEEVTA